MYFQSRKVVISGFTLVELLVCILILSILSGFTLSVMSGAKQRARIELCSSNLKQQWTGIGLYRGDYDDRLPIASNTDEEFGNCNGVEKNGFPMFHILMKPFLNSSEIFHCPFDNGVPSSKEWKTVEDCHFQGSSSLFLSYGSSYWYHTGLAFEITKGGLPSSDPKFQSLNVLRDYYYGWKRNRNTYNAISLEGKLRMIDISGQALQESQ
jgi:prepilin-type N-terminal cleavage/methylation domain-containing protein